MSGLRLVCKTFIQVTSWEHDFVVVNSRLVDNIPLPCMASFDLLNPLDNSGNGHVVTKAGGVIKPYGLDFNRSAGGSSTDFSANSDGITVLCAVKPNSYSAYSTFISCRNEVSGAGSGFSVDFSPTDKKIRLSVVYPSGGNVAFSFPTFIEGEWNILCFTMSSTVMRGENQHDEVIQNIFSSPINLTQWAKTLLLGQGSSGGTCDGSVGFVSIYNGLMNAEQRKAAVKVGSEVMASRI